MSAYRSACRMHEKTEGRSCNPKKTEGVESTTEQQEGKSKKEALAA
jgi:hypothetical protein